MKRATNPFTEPCPVEILLIDPPLVRVVCQVRFPLIASITKQDFIGPFQEAIRRQYPTLRSEVSQGFAFSPAGIAQVIKEHIWRFLSKDETWMVSLAPGFLALETSAYHSKQDFLERMQVLLSALAEHFEPPEIDRLGVRFIDQIVPPELDLLERFVHQDVLGVSASPIKESMLHSVTEHLFDLPQGQLRTRWGYLPEGMSFEPAAIEPVPSKSWILDLDMFNLEPLPMDPALLVRRLDDFAQVNYAFFRWVVTDDFLEHYQGELEGESYG